MSVMAVVKGLSRETNRIALRHVRSTPVDRRQAARAIGIRAARHGSWLCFVALSASLLVVPIGCGGKSPRSGSAAGVDAAPSGPCVNVSGVGAEPWYNLTIAGTQFDADEGARMRIIVATQTPNRVGVGDVSIVNGAFALSMPQVLNAGYYVGISLYVDRNENNTCETSEDAWDFATPAVFGDLQYDVTPDKWCFAAGCLLRAQQTGAACWVGTGQTDLTKPLPCTP